jgi:hypothetical protein
MVLLGDIGQLEAHFGPFRDSINLEARYVHGLRRTYYRLGNHFGRHRWHSYVTWVKWKLILVYLEIMLTLAQDRCMVCAECTMGMANILGGLERTPR